MISIKEKLLRPEYNSEDNWYVHVEHIVDGETIDERVFFDGEIECITDYLLTLSGDVEEFMPQLKSFENVKLIP